MLAMGGNLTPRIELHAVRVGYSWAPRIVAAECGYTCMERELRAWDGPTAAARERATCIRKLAHAMRDHEEGLFVAFASAPGAPAPMALIQDDRPYRKHNFYSHRQTRRDR